MLITEYDGDTILCPVRAHRLGEDNKNHGCETVQCMAWRWYDSPDADKRRGYCGLADRPDYDEDGENPSYF